MLKLLAKLPLIAQFCFQLILLMFIKTASFFYYYNLVENFLTILIQFVLYYLFF